MTGHAVLPRRAAVIVFLAFAFAYFLSALVRAVTATLAPTLAQELQLPVEDLLGQLGATQALAKRGPALAQRVKRISALPKRQ